jgi:hypothetical protein
MQMRVSYLCKVRLPTRRTHSPGRGARASGETAEGVAWIENGIRDIRSTRSTLNMPYTDSGVCFSQLLVLKETHIEASFCAAIRTAREQKSVSLEKRVEGIYQNTGGKKRATREDVDSAYRFVNAKREIPK